MHEEQPSTPPEAGLFERGAALAAGVRAFLSEHAAAARGVVETRDAAVARAERQRRAAVDAADVELERRRSKAAEELEGAVERLEAGRAEQRTKIAREWDGRIAGERERYEQRLERLERKRREAVWLAETVLESARPKPRQAFDALCKRLDAGLAAVDEWESFADSLSPGMGPAGGAREGTAAAGEDSLEAFEASAERVESMARGLERRLGGRMFRSGSHYLLAPAVGAAAAAGAGWATSWDNWRLMPGAGAAGLAVAAVVLIPVWRVSRRRLREGIGAVREEAARARAIGEAARARGERERDEAVAALVAECKAEVQRAGREAEEQIAALEGEHASRMGELEAERERRLGEAEASAARERGELEERVRAYREQAEARRAAEVSEAEETWNETRERAEREAEAALEGLRRAWCDRVEEFQRGVEAVRSEAERMSPSWEARASGAWKPRAEGSPGARVGEVRLELGEAQGAAPVESRSEAAFPERVSLPVVVETSSRASLLVEAGAEQRDEGLAVLQTSLLRLLASIPAGRAKLTLVDPVGRGRSFAGLMRLSDHDESLVGSRIWTESRHIEQRLADLTEHIENVIQKYLRDEYSSIEEYNLVAGEIAEPYRYLVIADFPANFSEDAVTRLASIIDAGPRCGVFVAMLTDPAAAGALDLRRLRARAVVLRPSEAGGFRIADERLTDLPFESDAPPSEAEATAVLDRIGAEALAAGRVEVRYGVVEPPESERWTRSAAEELRVPIGRAGATRAQELRLGKGTSQHALIAGKTGSGKSTLLHVLATAAMQWHDPGEVEFYLVDFKKGVEFKPYASGRLPHVRAVAIESDREFGLSVLQRLDEELRRRGDLFRDRGIQSLAQHRAKHPSEPMPRTLLIIDEFQEFFVEDDRIAQDASLLLDRLVRQGRAFGVHVLLASQTLSGAYTLARSTVGQMAVRIALKCSETDSYLILSEDNAAARLLSRPGEAIYNDANGLVEGNHPFQVAWLSDEEREGVLRRVESLAAERGVEFPEPVLFEGNAPAELGRNRLLRRAVRERARPVAPIAWLGEPVSIKDPTGAVMRRRGGANLLIVGQRAETAAAMLAASAVSLAAQHERERQGKNERAARFVVVDGTPEDDPMAGRLAEALAPLGERARALGWREAPVAVGDAHAEMRRREEANRTDAPAHYVALHGLHWLRSLRRKDDDFSFGMGREEEGPRPDAQLRELLVDGPRLGVFVLAWCDTVSSLTRALDRGSIGEFGNRVLMQMSANDSSMLIESTSASRLGLHRAVFFDEERGAEEKFRPYGMPSAREVADVLGVSGVAGAG